VATSIDKAGDEAKAPAAVRGPLAQLIGPISQVPGVVAIGLGGSRSIGTSVPSSDFDVIIFSGPEPQLDHARMAEAVQQLGGKMITSQRNPGESLLAEITIGNAKIELFFRKMSAIAAEIEGARQGRFRRSFNALHVVGFISTILISYATYVRPVWDPEGKLKDLIASAFPYPDALRNQMINVFRSDARVALGHAAKVRSPEDLPHLMALYSRVIASWNLVLFAANRKYPVIDKGGRKLVSTFERTPPGYEFRSAAILRAAAAGDLKGANTEAERLHRDVVAAALAE